MVALASSLIGLLGLLLSLAFRRQSAAVRFSIWQMVTCGVVMSTALIFLVDGVAIGPVQNSTSIGFASDLRSDLNLLPMPNKHAGFQYEVPQSVSDSLANTSSPQFTTKTSSDANEPIRVVDENEKAQPPSTAPLPAISWAALIGAIWICLGLILSFRVAKSSIRAWMIVRQATLPDGRQFPACLRVAARRVGLKSGFDVRLVQTDRMSVPFTIGFVRPTVVIPKEADDWSTEKLTMVLAHELAHVKRRDVFWQWVSRVACCFTGFNPLTWLAARRCAIEREHACDDCVIGCWFRRCGLWRNIARDRVHHERKTNSVDWYLDGSACSASTIRDRAGRRNGSAASCSSNIDRPVDGICTAGGYNRNPQTARASRACGRTENESVSRNSTANGQA